MTKKAAALFTTGIGFLSLSIPSFNDLLMQILYKLFDVTYPSQINTYVGIITGFILVITAFLITYNENKNKKTLAIIGLDTIQVSKKLKNPVIINIIDNINFTVIKLYPPRITKIGGLVSVIVKRHDARRLFTVIYFKQVGFFEERRKNIVRAARNVAIS